MRMVHLYEILVADRDPGRDFRLLVIPREAMTARDAEEDPSALTTLLGLKTRRKLSSHTALTPAIMAMFGSADTEAAVSRLDVLLNSPSMQQADPDAAALAEHIAFAEVIPFRDSPRSKRSLVSARDLSKRADMQLRVCDVHGRPVLALAGPAGLTIGAVDLDLKRMLGRGISLLTDSSITTMA
jgi:hypothetical protein